MLSTGGLPHGAVPKLERPGTLREQVYEALLGLITSRTLRPGQHLVENELASRLGVSRQPVREALQRLSTEGWVDLRPAQGAFVHQPTCQEAEQLLVVRALLEVEAARLAAANAPESGPARLERLCDVGEAAFAAEDTDGVVTANAGFHAYVMELAGNAVLAELSAQVDRRVRWYYTPVAMSRGRQAWGEHRDLVAAIADRDTARAQRVMRTHTERTRVSYHQHAKQARPDR